MYIRNDIVHCFLPFFSLFFIHAYPYIFLISFLFYHASCSAAGQTLVLPLVLQNRFAAGKNTLFILQGAVYFPTAPFYNVSTGCYFTYSVALHLGFSTDFLKNTIFLLLYLLHIKMYNIYLWFYNVIFHNCSEPSKKPVSLPQNTHRQILYTAMQFLSYFQETDLFQSLYQLFPSIFSSSPHQHSMPGQPLLQLHNIHSGTDQT